MVIRVYILENTSPPRRGGGGVNSVVEPQGAGAFGRSWSWYSEVLAPAPGQTKVVYLVIIPIE